VTRNKIDIIDGIAKMTEMVIEKEMSLQRQIYLKGLQLGMSENIINIVVLYVLYSTDLHIDIALVLSVCNYYADFFEDINISYDILKQLICKIKKLMAVIPLLKRMRSDIQTALAIHYYNVHDGTTYCNRPMAITLFQAAIAENNPIAQHCLGWHYFIQSDARGRVLIAEAERVHTDADINSGLQNYERLLELLIAANKDDTLQTDDAIYNNALFVIEQKVDDKIHKYNALSALTRYQLKNESVVAVAAVTNVLDFFMKNYLFDPSFILADDIDHDLSSLFTKV
jgi:hypothetical protein